MGNSRIEKILSAIRDGVNPDELPTPVNRDEALIQALYKNHVAERTHWVEKRVRQIVSTKTIQNARDGYVLNPTLGVLKGSTNYTCIVDGVVYSQRTGDDSSQGYFTLGNIAFIDYPFFIRSTTDSTTQIRFREKKQHTLTIIDNDAKTIIVNDIIIYEDELVNQGSGGYEYVLADESLYIGNTNTPEKDSLIDSELIVTFDGVDYLVNAYYSDWDKSTLAGNAYLGDDGRPNTGHPFAFWFWPNSTAIILAKDNEPHTVSIKQKYGKYNTIDPKFLPKATVVNGEIVWGE